MYDGWLLWQFVLIIEICSCRSLFKVSSNLEHDLHTHESGYVGDCHSKRHREQWISKEQPTHRKIEHKTNTSMIMFAGIVSTIQEMEENQSTRHDELWLRSARLQVLTGITTISTHDPEASDQWRLSLNITLLLTCIPLLIYQLLSVGLKFLRCYPE